MRVARDNSTPTFQNFAAEIYQDPVSAECNTFSVWATQVAFQQVLPQDGKGEITIESEWLFPEFALVMSIFAWLDQASI